MNFKNKFSIKTSIDKPPYKIIRLILALKTKEIHLINIKKSEENSLLLNFQKENSLLYNQEYIYQLKDKNLGVFYKNQNNSGYISLEHNWTITEEDLNQMKKILMYNYEKEIDAEKYITSCLLSDKIFAYKLKWNFKKLNSIKEINTISNYFKIDEDKLNYIKPILQMFLLGKWYLKYIEIQHLQKIIKKFNFKFNPIPEKIENEIDEMINNILKIKSKEFLIKLSKYLAIKISKVQIGKHLNKISLKITGLPEIFFGFPEGKKISSFNSMNFIRKKYIYNFLYNNNLIPKLEINSLKLLITHI